MISLALAIALSAPVTLRDGILTSRGPSAGFASMAQIDGSFAVAWTELSGSGDHLFIAPLPSLYAAIDTTRTVDAGPVAQFPVPSFTSGGPYYAASYSDAAGRWVRLYDRDLAPVVGPLPSPNPDPSQLAWNGSDFIVPGTPYLNLLDANGIRQVLGALDSNLETTLRTGASTPDGARALVVAWPSFPCFDICATPPVRLTAYALDETHHTLAKTLISDSAYPIATVAGSSTNFVVVWIDMRNFVLSATVFGYNGDKWYTIPLQSFINVNEANQPTLIAGDGEEFLVIRGGKLTQIVSGGVFPPIPIDVKGSARLLRTGMGSYALTYIDTADGIHGKIQLVRITTQPGRGRGSRH